MGINVFLTDVRRHNWAFIGFGFLFEVASIWNLQLFLGLWLPQRGGKGWLILLRAMQPGPPIQPPRVELTDINAANAKQGREPALSEGERAERLPRDLPPQVWPRGNGWGPVEGNATAGRQVVLLPVRTIAG